MTNYFCILTISELPRLTIELIYYTEISTDDTNEIIIENTLYITNYAEFNLDHSEITIIRKLGILTVQESK